jgi:hypothetical protein
MGILSANSAETWNLFTRFMNPAWSESNQAGRPESDRFPSGIG